MLLSEALAIKSGEVVVLVGGGGKTTAMLLLARELQTSGRRVVITTTTKIAMPAQRDNVIIEPDPGRLLQAVDHSTSHGEAIIAGEAILPPDKIKGLAPEVVCRISQESGVDVVLVEGDGSAGLPFKAPAAFEPVIPICASVVVPVVGLDALSQIMIAGRVHRPEIVAELTGAAVGDKINPELIARVYLHPRGYRKAIPAGSRWIPLLNKADLLKDLSAARRLAALLIAGGADRVILGALGRQEPVWEVIGQ